MKNLEVEAILKFYRYVDLDIKVASEWLEQYEAGYNPLGAVVYDGMPHGSTLSDSTALLAVKLAEVDTRESIDTLKKRIKELKKLRTEIFKEISYSPKVSSNRFLKILRPDAFLAHGTMMRA